MNTYFWLYLRTQVLAAKNIRLQQHVQCCFSPNFFVFVKLHSEGESSA